MNAKRLVGFVVISLLLACSSDNEGGSVDSGGQGADAAPDTRASDLPEPVFQGGGETCSDPVIVPPLASTDALVHEGDRIFDRQYSDDHYFENASCASEHEDTPDLVFQIDLEAGQVLGVEKLAGALTLVLTESCQENAPCVTDIYEFDDLNGLIWEAPADQTVFVVASEYRPTYCIGYNPCRETRDPSVVHRLRFTMPVCGDGAVLFPEVCDDGNGDADDGCTGCEVDFGWICESDGGPSACVANNHLGTFGPGDDIPPYTHGPLAAEEVASVLLTLTEPLELYVEITAPEADECCEVQLVGDDGNPLHPGWESQFQDWAWQFPAGTTEVRVRPMLVDGISSFTLTLSATPPDNGGGGDACPATRSVEPYQLGDDWCVAWWAQLTEAADVVVMQAEGILLYHDFSAREIGFVEVDTGTGEETNRFSHLSYTTPLEGNLEVIPFLADDGGGNTAIGYQNDAGQAEVLAWTDGIEEPLRWSAPGLSSATVLESVSSILERYLLIDATSVGSVDGGRGLYGIKLWEPEASPIHAVSNLTAGGPLIASNGFTSLVLVGDEIDGGHAIRAFYAYTLQGALVEPPPADAETDGAVLYEGPPLAPGPSIDIFEDIDGQNIWAVYVDADGVVYARRIYAVDPELSVDAPVEVLRPPPGIDPPAVQLSSAMGQLGIYAADEHDVRFMALYPR